MQKVIHNYAKIGIIHFMAFPETLKGEGPIAETLSKILKDDYFTAVEISWVKNKNERERVKEILEYSGMYYTYGAQPAILTMPLNPNSSNEDERKTAIKILKEQIDMAFELGAKKLAILSGKDPGEKERKKEIDLLIGTIEELCIYAREKDMTITLEIFDRDIDKKALVGPTSTALYIAQEVRKRCNNFGLMADLAHLPLLGESAQQALLPIAAYLIHAHIGNCVLRNKNHPAYGDNHPRFCIEDGENGLEELVDFLKVLLDIAYLNEKEKPILSFEVKPLPGEDIEIIIAASKRLLNEAWALV